MKIKGFASKLTVAVSALAVAGAGAFVAPALADNSVTATVKPGELTSSITGANLGEADYSFVAETLEGDFAVAVADARGSDTGWNVTVQSSPFEYDGNSEHAADIEASNLNVTPDAPVWVAGAEAEELELGSLGNLASARKVLSAPDGAGQGSYTQNLSAILTVPAMSSAGQYTASLTVTANDGPGA